MEIDRLPHKQIMLTLTDPLEVDFALQALMLTYKPSKSAPELTTAKENLAKRTLLHSVQRREEKLVLSVLESGILASAVKEVVTKLSEDVPINIDPAIASADIPHSMYKTIRGFAS